MFIILQDFSADEGFIGFGLAGQGHYGDNTTPEPSAVNLAEKWKWDSYEQYKGMPKEEARQKFIEWAMPIMDRNNYDWREPQQKLIEDKYKKCIDAKLAEGKSLEEIEAARQAYIDS